MRFGKIGSKELVAKNLFVWPTKVTFTYAQPTTEWTPKFGVWYKSTSDNGYFNSSERIIELTNDFIRIEYAGGYGSSVFLQLNPGKYIISSYLSG